MSDIPLYKSSYRKDRYMEISGVSSKAYTSAAQGVDEEEKVEELDNVEEN